MNQHPPEPATGSADKCFFPSSYKSSLTANSSRIAPSISSTTPSVSSRSYTKQYNKTQRSGRPSKYYTQPSSLLHLDELPSAEKNLYVALDCEMVGVGYAGQESAAARVTMVDWYGNVLLDEYIIPNQEVTDYRTFVSGITPQQLEERQGAIGLVTCREKVLRVLRGRCKNSNLLYQNKMILVGHGLKIDLHVLGIIYPRSMIRDTAEYEPFMKERFGDGGLWPRKLKDLVEENLHRKIQVEGQPHSPYEDAKAALDLYKVVRIQWETELFYHNMIKANVKQQRYWYHAQHQKFNCYFEQHGLHCWTE